MATSVSAMEPVYRTVVAAALSVMRARKWDLSTSGWEHVPAEGGAVIASNHVSYIDFVFLGAAARNQGKRLVRFMAKKEAFDHPVSGPLMRAMRHVEVDRFGDPKKAFDEAVEKCRSGELVGTFPEGSISRSFTLLPLKTGAARIAQAAGVPLVPVAVWGTQRLLTKDRPRDLRRDVPVTVRFGEPIQPGDDDPAEVTKALDERLSELVDAAQRSYPVPPQPGYDWWQPAHLGGSAPTYEEAMRLHEKAKRERAARRQAELEGS